MSEFIDISKLSKNVFDKATVGNQEEENLLKCLLSVDYKVDNALFDVLSLKELYVEKIPKNCNASDLYTSSHYSVISSGHIVSYILETCQLLSNFEQVKTYS